MHSVFAFVTKTLRDSSPAQLRVVTATGKSSYVGLHQATVSSLLRLLLHQIEAQLCLWVVVDVRTDREKGAKGKGCVDVLHFVP